MSEIDQFAECEEKKRAKWGYKVKTLKDARKYYLYEKIAVASFKCLLILGLCVIIFGQYWDVSSQKMELYSWFFPLGVGIVVLIPLSGYLFLRCNPAYSEYLDMHNLDKYAVSGKFFTWHYKIIDNEVSKIEKTDDALTRIIFGSVLSITSLIFAYCVLRPYTEYVQNAPWSSWIWKLNNIQGYKLPIDSMILEIICVVALFVCGKVLFIIGMKFIRKYVDILPQFEDEFDARFKVKICKLRKEHHEDKVERRTRGTKQEDGGENGETTVHDEIKNNG